MIKKISVFILLSVGLLAFSSALNVPHRIRKVTTVVIDAGHGGKDPGCLGVFSHEKDVALSVALELGALIKKMHPQINVLYTRVTDTFVELHERTNIANKAKADLFISIHCNASTAKDAYGTETYIMGQHKTDDNLLVAKRENNVILMESDHETHYENFDPNSPIGHIVMVNQQNAFAKNSLALAQKIEEQFKDKVLRKSRGVKQAGFLVLWRTAMPSVLIEIGFLTNKTEEVYLNSEKGKMLIASGIYRAFRDYKIAIEEKYDE